MADKVYYVDTDVVGGSGTGEDWENAFNSSAACEAVVAEDLTDGDTCTVYCRATSGTADDSFTINGFITDATHYVTWVGWDFPADGIFDTDYYRIHNNDATLAAVNIADDHVRLVNLQIQVTVTSTNSRYGVYIASVAAGSIVHVDSCIVKGVSSTTGACYGVYPNDADLTLYLFNTTLYGFINGSDTDHAGLYNAGATSYVYNCTAYGNYYGFRQASGSCTFKNCISGNNTDDFLNGTISYCCSDDGDGDPHQHPSGDNWANEMNDPANGNFSLKAGGNCIGNGTDNPGSGLYLDDIIGTTRTSTWDIGAFEFLPPDLNVAVDDGIGIADAVTVIWGGWTQLRSRWRDDDADEDEATWLGNEDTTLQRPIQTNTRLRVQIECGGNPDASRFKLQYRKQGDSEWIG